MAAWRSPISKKAAPAPLVVPLSAITSHHVQLAAEVGQLTGQGREVHVDGSFTQPRATVGFVGAACEPADRVRGRTTQVLQLRHLGAHLWAWIGYQEEWDSDGGRVKRNPTFTFRSAGLTVHLGLKGNRQKPQVFRAEWAGWTTWPGSIGFQAGNAGHPHWQFDALDSLGMEADAEDAQALLDLLRLEGAGIPPREFVPYGVEEEDIRSLVRQRPLSRIHFPSGAQWWRAAPLDAHAHAPSNVEELRRWVVAVISYVGPELDRLSTT